MGRRCTAARGSRGGSVGFNKPGQLVLVISDASTNPAQVGARAHAAPVGKGLRCDAEEIGGFLSGQPNAAHGGTPFMDVHHARMMPVADMRRRNSKLPESRLLIPASGNHDRSSPGVTACGSDPAWLLDESIPGC